MGRETGIKWTDSTYNSWWGCTKVGPACDHCYAEGVDKRTGENHWGHGAVRRLLSEHARNEPYRWQKQADKFYAEHGRRQRVFTLSMGDLFDN
jgi:protein gp37